MVDRPLQVVQQDLNASTTRVRRLHLHFRGPDFAARASNDLFNVSQQAEETVDTFALRFSDLLELAMETDLRMDAVHQINLFSRALRPELQETVMKQ